MFLYLFQVTILWLAFSAVYRWVLSGKNIFRFNRWYLMITLVGSLLVPLIPFESLFGNAVVFQNHLLAPPVRLQELVIDLNDRSTNESANPFRFIEILFGIGVLVFSLRFLNELRKLRKLYRQADKEMYDELMVCKINQAHQVFTFGNIVFVHRDLFENFKSQNMIWQHEKTHALQWHSADVLLVELCKILFWFHPLIYLYEQNIKMNHEYLADEAVLEQTHDVKAYQHKLLDYIENNSSALASAFNFKLTQKRFIMMKIKNNQWTKTTAKMFAILGVVATVSFVACSKDKVNEQDQDKKTEKIPYTELTVEEKDASYELETPKNFVQQKAKPSEGIQMFYREFATKFQTPKIPELDSQDEIGLRLTFVVEKDGSLSDIKEVTGANELLANEAIRVLKSMPYWIPAQHEGKIVRSTFTLPIKIRVSQ